MRTDKENQDLVVQNYGLLVACIKRFKVKSLDDQDDMKSIGAIALVKASQTWDSEKSKFSTYATHCISNAFKNYIRYKKNDKLVTGTGIENNLETKIRFNISDYSTVLDSDSENIVMYKKFGYTNKEIAVLCNIPIGRITKLYNKAIKRMKEINEA